MRQSCPLLVGYKLRREVLLYQNCGKALVLTDTCNDGRGYPGESSPPDENAWVRSRRDRFHRRPKDIQLETQSQDSESPRYEPEAQWLRSSPYYELQLRF